MEAATRRRRADGAGMERPAPGASASATRVARLQPSLGRGMYPARSVMAVAGGRLAARRHAAAAACAGSLYGMALRNRWLAFSWHGEFPLCTSAAGNRCAGSCGAPGGAPHAWHRQSVGQPGANRCGTRICGQRRDFGGAGRKAKCGVPGGARCRPETLVQQGISDDAPLDEGRTEPPQCTSAQALRAAQPKHEERCDAYRDWGSANEVRRCAMRHRPTDG